MSSKNTFTHDRDRDPPGLNIGAKGRNDNRSGNEGPGHPPLDRTPSGRGFKSFGKLHFTKRRASERRQQDPEMGTGGINSFSVYPAGCPSLARFREENKDSSVYRRFSWLHVRILLYRLDELHHLEEELQNQDEQTENREYPSLARDRLGQAINAKLSAYDPMLLAMKSLRQQVPKPIDGRYTSAREWIRNGPLIHIELFDTKDPRWQEYTSAVTTFLDESIDSDLLDCSIDHYWTKDLGITKQRAGPECMTTLKEMWDNLSPMVAVFFWICHIVAALGFILVTNGEGYQTCPASSDKTLAECLFMLWGLSTAGVVIHQSKYHGNLYLRKIVFGGIAACGGGFATLKLLLLASTTTALTAIPAIFTAVLLIAKVM